MMTHDEMIAVIQAHRDGKEVQARQPRGEWFDVAVPAWNFDVYEYRAKPREPRRIYAHFTPCGILDFAVEVRHSGMVEFVEVIKE